MRINIPYITLLFLFPFLIKAQNNNSQREKTIEDSALNVINSNLNDTIKINLLNNWANELRRNNPDKTIEYAKKAISIAEKSNHLRYTPQSLICIGTAYLNKSELTISYDYFKKAIESGEQYKDKKTISAAYNNIGIMHIKKDNFSEALKYYLLALEIRKEIGEKSAIGSSLINVGNIYFRQKIFNEAEKYYKNSITYFSNSKDQFKISTAYNNLGLIAQEEKKYEKAIEYFDLSLKYCLNDNDLRSVQSAYINKAKTFFQMNKIHEAVTFLNKTEELNAKTNDKETWFNILKLKKEIEIKNKNFIKVEKLAKEMLDSANKIGKLGEIGEAYLMLSLVEKNRKNYKKAFEYYELLSNIKDSLFNDNNLNKIYQQQFNHEIQEKENEYKERQIRNEVETNEKIKQQKIITIFSISIGIVVLFSLIISLRAYFSKQKANNIILKQKQLVEQKQKEIIDSINYAKKLQEAIVTPLHVVERNFPESFVLYKPKDIVAGDFYWLAEHHSKTYVAVCDCTGHGVPGAFMSLLNIGYLNEAVKEKNITNTGLVFDYVRSKLIEHINKDGQKDGMDGILMCFDKTNNKIYYSAANNSPILIRDNTLSYLTTDKMPVGIGYDTSPFSCNEINLKKGDIIYLFTDGYADQFGGPKGKKFKYKQLEELLIEICITDIKNQKQILEDAFEKWKGELEQVDDICIIGIKI